MFLANQAYNLFFPCGEFWEKGFGVFDFQLLVDQTHRKPFAEIFFTTIYFPDCFFQNILI
jgi:hypothetical protein